MKQEKSLVKDQSGFTLVEVLVVIMLVGIMALVSVNLIASLFDAQIRANQQLDQQTTIETMYGFLASRLATAQRPIGTTVGSGATEATDPLSIAGDQIMFTSQGSCYRVFYVKAAKQVRAMVAGDCGDSIIKPVRGPNQTQQTPQEYDSALDKPLGTTDSSFVLVDGIIEDKPYTAPATADSKLLMFQYLGENGQPIAGTSDTTAPDKEAFLDRNGPFVSNAQPNLPNHSTFYDHGNLGYREDIAAVNVTAYVDPIAYAQGGAKVTARYYKQTMSLQQVCAVPSSGSSGATPGSVWIHNRVDGNGNVTAWRVGADTGAYNKVYTTQASTTSPLASAGNAEVPMQASWFNFDGVVTVHNASQPYSIKVTLLNDKTGTFTAFTDDGGNNRSEFVYNFPASASANPVTSPFEGAFKLQSSQALSGSNYKIEVEIKTASGSGLQYDTSEDTIWLDYDVVAY